MSDETAGLKEWIIRGKRNEAVQETKKALAAGIDPATVMAEAIAAMSIVGQKFSTGEFFLPQMMIAARAMSEIMAILKPRLLGAAAETKGKAVIGTAAGDFHDIGKNIVKMMLESAGYQVVDLGVDVAPDRFVQAVHDERPDFLLMSALLTLTMENMRRTIDALRAAGVRGNVRVGVGGAPLTKKFADDIGADFYSPDAYECVETCNRIMHSSHRPSPEGAEAKQR